MKTTTSIFALALCGALTIGAGSALAGPAAPMQPDDMSNGSDQPITDTWITTKVKTELATTKGVESTDISVTTVDGVVTLTGVVASDLEQKKAVAAAQSVKGVKKVDDSGLKVK